MPHIIYQVIKHEYSDDDGHYDHDPVDDIVYAVEHDAIKVRDALNIASVTEHNLDMATYYADAYGSEIVRRYAERNSFRGNPVDVDAIKRFADRESALTFYTVNTLRLFS